MHKEFGRTINAENFVLDGEKIVPTLERARQNFWVGSGAASFDFKEIRAAIFLRVEEIFSLTEEFRIGIGVEKIAVGKFLIADLQKNFVAESVSLRL